MSKTASSRRCACQALDTSLCQRRWDWQQSRSHKARNILGRAVNKSKTMPHLDGRITERMTSSFPADIISTVSFHRQLECWTQGRLATSKTSLLADETSSQQQQARTYEVGDVEKHHFDDRFDVEASLHRPRVKHNFFGARRLMPRLIFKLSCQVLRNHGTALAEAACRRCGS